MRTLRPPKPDTRRSASEALAGRAPVVWNFLIAQMANTGDERVVTLLLRPINGRGLCLRSMQNAVGVVLDDVAHNSLALTSFWACFDIDICHGSAPCGGY